jgi:hypothetical protein
MKKNKKHASLATFLQSLMRLVKGTAKPLTPTREECNKYDLTASSCVSLANRNNWFKWFVISSSHLFVVPVLILWVWLGHSEQAPTPAPQRMNDKVVWKQFSVGFQLLFLWVPTC